MSDDRSTVVVRQTGRMWRWYRTWQTLKYPGDVPSREAPKRQVDLCHFMRVLIFFAPWRWFWQKPLFRGWATPGFLAIAATMIAAFVWSFFAWTHVTAVVTGIAAACVAAISAVAFLVVWIVALVKDDPDRFYDRLVNVLYYGFVWLWWPGLKIGKYVLAPTGKFFGRHVARPVGEWMVRPLFSIPFGDYLQSFTPFGLLIGALASFVVVWNLYDNTTVTLIVIGGVVAVIAILALGIFAGVAIHDWWKNRPEDTDRPEKEKKDREASRVFWRWLVAKKHRVCPFVEAK